MTDVELWLLYSNTLKYAQKLAQARFKMLYTKCIYKSYI